MRSSSGKRRSRKGREPNWCKKCKKQPTDFCRAQHPNRLTYSTPYVRGRGFEYSVMNSFKKHGCISFRRYASKGAFDIIVIPPKNAADTRPMLIQAKKAGYFPKDEEAKFLELGRTLAARLLLAFSSNGKVRFREYPN